LGATNKTEMCEILQRLKDNSIQIGDINMLGIDWLKGRLDTNGKELLETTLEEGLYQWVSFPTHIKGNVLDLAVTTCHKKVLDTSDTGRLEKSDHCMLKITVEADPQIVREERTGYDWKKADMEAIARKLDRTDWRIVVGKRSVEEAWRYLTDTLSKAIERNVPKGRPRIEFRHPWMTKEILRLVRRKRRL
jgi:hypothetical protein